MPKPLAEAPKNSPSDYSQYNEEDGPFWTADTGTESSVYFAETGYASAATTPSTTLIEMFEKAVKKGGSKIAMRTEGEGPLKKGQQPPPAKPLEEWKAWTWAQYQADARAVAKALVKLGAEQHDAVNILGFNSPEWFLAFMGSAHAGCKGAGIYPSDTPDQVQYKSFHSDGAVAFVEDELAFSKFKQVIEDLPYLKAIVAWSYKPESDITREDGSEVKCMTFSELLEFGRDVDDKTLDERIAKIRSGHAVALIYTSGTTGRPKAVMISHDNLTYESAAVLPYSGGIGRKKEEERLISYLPLSHVAGMMVDIICPLAITANYKAYMNSNFARPYDLKAGTLGQRLGAVEPTLFIGVPRVWEKIMEKLLAVGAATKGLKKKLSTAAKKRGLIAQTNMLIGGSGKQPSWGFLGIYKKLLGIIKGKLGLSKCKFAFAGAAPMTLETLKYFASLNLNINEVYGMSECTGACTWSTDDAHEWGSVGFEIPGTEVRIFQFKDDGSRAEVPPAPSIFSHEEKFQGEICFRGRNIMMGYLANPKLGDDHVEEIRQKNMDCITEDGFLRSGDKGLRSERGMVKITGRYKELIIGAGGENIAPVPIEDAWKAAAPYISNVMMVGNKRKFNVMLVTLKTKGATGELPGTNELDGAAAGYGQTIEGAIADGRIIEEITKVMKLVNSDGDATPSNAAKIQKFTILPMDFSVNTEELTATLKTKRSVVENKYDDIIDAMYTNSDVFVPYSTVGSYAVGAGDESAGSFRAKENLDMVDDDVAAEASDMPEDEEDK